MDPIWQFLIMAAGLVALFSLAQLGSIEIRLRYSRSRSTHQTIRQVEILARHSKKITIVAAVALVLGIALLLAGQVLGLVPSILGLMLAQVALMNRVAMKRVQRANIPPMSFRPSMPVWYATMAGGGIILGGIMMVVRTRDPVMLLWLIPMTVFALLGFVVYRSLATYQERIGSRP